MLMRRRIAQGAAVLGLTLVIAWMLGHVHWPEAVGLAMVRASDMVGGRGIEDTEDLFMLVCFAVALVVAVAIVAAVSRRAGRARDLSVSR